MSSTPDRRSFLRGAGLSTAGLLLAACTTPPSGRTPGRPAAPSTGTARRDAAAPSRRLGLACIGLGNMGGGHLGGLVWEKRVQIVALCDVDRERLAQARGRVDEAYAKQTESGLAPKGILTTADFREAIAHPGVDAVLLCLPDHWHAIPLIAAARAGKHIYAEKPLSLTIPEGRAMVRAVEESGVVCQIGSQQRSSAEFQRVVDLARNGFLGRLQRVDVGLPGGAGPGLTPPLAPQTVPPHFDYERWLGPAPWAPYFAERCHWNWRWILDYSGGQLTDWVGHHFDIGAWAAGVTHTGPTAIRAARATFADGPLYDTAHEYAFEAHYATGPVFSVATKNRNGVKVTGDDGWVWANRGAIEFSHPRLRHVPLPAQGFRAGPPEWHFTDFLDAVATGTRPRCPIEEAHRVVSVAHLANLAFRTGRAELRWDPEQERILDAPDAARLLGRAYRGPWTLPA